MLIKNDILNTQSLVKKQEVENTKSLVKKEERIWKDTTLENSKLLHSTNMSLDIHPALNGILNHWWNNVLKSGPIYVSQLQYLTK